MALETFFQSAGKLGPLFLVRGPNLCRALRQVTEVTKELRVGELRPERLNDVPQLPVRSKMAKVRPEPPHSCLRCSESVSVGFGEGCLQGPQPLETRSDGLTLIVERKDRIFG